MGLTSYLTEDALDANAVFQRDVNGPVNYPAGQPILNRVHFLVVVLLGGQKRSVQGRLVDLMNDAVAKVDCDHGCSKRKSPRRWQAMRCVEVWGD